MTNLHDFLLMISNDHQTFDFPIILIQKELTIMYLDRNDFEEGLLKAYHKLNKKHGEVLANVFMTLANVKLRLKDNLIDRMTDEEYQDWLDSFFDSLGSLKITRIEKDSPDGLMLSTMQTN